MFLNHIHSKEHGEEEEERLKVPIACCCRVVPTPPMLPANSSHKPLLKGGAISTPETRVYMREKQSNVILVWLPPWRGCVLLN